MTHLLLILLMVTAVPRVQADDPLSIVSMTLDDEALARAHDVALSGDIAYVPGKDQSLSVIDITDPKNPQVLGSESFPKYKKDALKSDNYHDLVYRDGYLYVSA